MRAWTALAVGAAAAAAVVAGGRAVSQEAARPPCAAFVSVSKAFQAHPRRQKIEESLKADMDLINATLEKQKADLRKEAQDLEARFSAGTPEFQQGLKKLDLRKYEVEYDAKASIDVLRRKQVTAFAQAYREIVAEAERIAREKGFCGVLNFDDEPLEAEDKSGQVMGPNDLKLQIALRTVLWAGPDADLTKDVIAALEKGK